MLSRALPPSSVTLSPAELDLSLGGHFFNGPWAGYQILEYPPPEPGAEWAGGDGVADPAGEPGLGARARRIVAEGRTARPKRGGQGLGDPGVAPPPRSVARLYQHMRAELDAIRAEQADMAALAMFCRPAWAILLEK